MKQFDIPNFNTDYNDLANLFNVYNDKDGNPYFNINRTIYFKDVANLPPAAFVSYQIKESDTWTSISYDNYATHTLWWLICSYNNIMDPTTFPEPGTIIKLPTNSVVDLVLKQIREQ